MAKAGDVIYCDPPYHPLSVTSNFTAYTSSPFQVEHQIKLAKLAETAALNGIHVLISNHDTEFTRMHYQKAKDIYSFEVARSISCRGNKRQKVREILAYYCP